jgi:hypothetical protein
VIVVVVDVTRRVALAVMVVVRALCRHRQLGKECVRMHLDLPGDGRSTNRSNRSGGRGEYSCRTLDSPVDESE